MSEANDKRCIAHQIIHDLHEAREVGQIGLLLMACSLSHKSLDPKAHREWLASAIAAMDGKGSYEAARSAESPSASPEVAEAWSALVRIVNQHRYKALPDGKMSNEYYWPQRTRDTVEIARAALVLVVVAESQNALVSDRGQGGSNA